MNKKYAFIFKKFNSFNAWCDYNSPIGRQTYDEHGTPLVIYPEKPHFTLYVIYANNWIECEMQKNKYQSENNCWLGNYEVVELIDSDTKYDFTGIDYCVCETEYKLKKLT